jgi:hypothetical protein
MAVETLEDLQTHYPNITQVGISRKGNQIWEYEGCLAISDDPDDELPYVLVWVVVDPATGRVLDYH